MNSARHLLLGLFLAASVAAPGSATPVKEFRSAGPIAVRAGEQFRVSLPANRTTGFSWTVAVDKPGVVTSVSTQYQPPASMRMGSGGRQSFVFAAQRIGLAHLSFLYQRPWEKHVKPAKTLTFTVRVSP